MNRPLPVAPCLLTWSRFLLPIVLLFLLSCSALAQTARLNTLACYRVSEAAATPPVRVTELTARASGKQHILVEWTTEGETDNDYFELERSDDGAHFVAVGHVTGKGTTRNRTEYNYFDFYPNPGAAYYRLRQVSFRKRAWITEKIAIRTDAGARQPIRQLPVIRAGEYALYLLAAK